jgi:AbrB family looped-hinge helix DNA binding protein
MGAVLISTKGQIVLPVAVRKALGLTPGMRVNVKVSGKSAQITPAPAKKVGNLKEIQALRKYIGPLVRAIVNDDTIQSAHSTSFKADNDISIPVTVMLELEWVPRSRYAFKPAVIAQAITKITALGNVLMGEHAAVLAAANKAERG